MVRGATKQRWHGLGRLAVLVLVLAGLQNPLAPAVAAPVAGTLTTTPGSPVMSNEQIRFEGSLPPSRARTVTLQRRLGSGAWTSVRTQKSRGDGGFTFTANAPTSAARVEVSYRVSAPTVVLSGTSHPAVETPTVTLWVVPQESSLDAPTRARLGSTFRVTAVFHPARAGRTVILQRRAGTSWTQVASGVQAANGTVSFNRPATPVGNVVHRVVARPFNGAAQVISTTRTTTVMAGGDMTPPPVPGGLTAVDDGTSVTLDWDAVSAPDLAGYRVYRGVTGAGPWVRLTAPSVSGTSFVDPSPVPGRVYAVSSVDTLGNESARSGSVTPAAGGDTTPPPVPTGLVATPGDTRLDLTWDPVDTPDLAGYRLYRSADGQGPWTPEPDLLTERDAQFTGLTNGTTYFFRISSEDLSGNESDLSPTLEAVPEDNQPPPVPHDVVTDATDREVLVSWSAEGPEDFLGFNVYVATSADGPWELANEDPVAIGEFRVTGLANGAEYWFAVTAVDTSGNESTRSASGTGTPVDDVPPAPPDGIEVTPGDRRATLSWGAVDDDGLAGYRVYRSTSQGGPWTLLEPDPVIDLEYVDTGLENGTEYWYLVTAVDEAGNESSLDGEVRVTPADDVAPPAPTGLAAAGSDGQVALSWEPVTDEVLSGYRVYRAPAQDGPWEEVGGLEEDSSRTVTGLTNGTTSWFVVVAVDAAGNESERSEPVEGTPVDDTPPPAPQGVAAAPGDRTATLTWDPVNDDNLVGYRVYRATGLGLTWTSLHPTPTTDWEYVDPDVENGVEYLYYVVAVDEWGQESGHEPPLVVTPADDVPPPAPENLVLVPGDSEITLTWDPVTDDGLVGYEVSRALSADGPWELLTAEPITETEYLDTGLQNGTGYWYVVRSLDAAGNRSTNDQPDLQFPVDLTPPAVPTGVQVAVDDGYLFVSWDAVVDTDLLGYQLYRADDADGPWTHVGEVTGGTDATVGGLTNGTTYWFAVSSVDTANNESQRSEPASGVPADLEPPLAPDQLFGEARDRAVALEWSAVEVADVVGYRLYRSDSEAGPWEQVGDDRQGTEALVEGLVNDRTYYFVATAFDEVENESAHSPVLAIAPDDDIAPNDPVGLVADAGDGRVDLSWDPGADADLVGYRIYRATEEGGPWALLNLTPQPGTTYADTGVDDDTEYFYRVTAVDDDDNESDPSATASATTQVEVNELSPTVSSLDRHACALRANGTVWCWGSGGQGALGDGSGIDRLTPVQAGTDSDWTDIDLAPGGTCALKRDQSMWCWGSDPVTGEVNLEPARAGTDRDWTSLEASRSHACALKSDHTLWCWGENSRGALGDGTTENRYSRAQVGTDDDWAQVFVGYYVTCATKLDASLWCWGDNYAGAVGTGSSDDEVLTPSRVGDGQWRVASSGAGTTCGVRPDGSLWCWGADHQGWMPGEDFAQRSPVRVGEDADWRSVTVGSGNVCGVKEDDTAWCWGGNVYGEVGDGTTVDRLAPVQVAGPDQSWAQMESANRTTCGVTVVGAVRCWGSGHLGTLGDGTSPWVLVPVPYEGGPQSWDVLRAGNGHSCGLDDQGGVWCRGGNSLGELGDGTFVKRQGLSRVGATTGWTQLSTGAHHSCGIRSGGTAWCWGYHSYGQLGDGVDHGGQTGGTPYPTQVGTAADWTELAPGIRHTCGLREGGSLWCWGNNFRGQLGDGTSLNAAAPRQVTGQWMTVTTAYRHSCGVRMDGTAWCWGSNDRGQLGTGGPVGESSWNSTPLQVGQESDWVSLSAGEGHTCGLRAGGSAWCWGEGSRLGTGSFDASAVPVRVEGSGTWVEIAAGAFHTCGRQVDGTAWCWGNGSSGEIGSGGATSYVLSPEEVSGGHQWADLDAGPSRTCGTTVEGGGYCWGQNLEGEAGVPIYRTTPGPVLEE